MKLRAVLFGLVISSQVGFSAPNDVVNCVAATKGAGLKREEVLELCQYAKGLFPYQYFFLAQKSPYHLKSPGARELCTGASNRGPLTCFVRVKPLLPDATDLELATLCNWTND